MYGDAASKPPDKPPPERLGIVGAIPALWIVGLIVLGTIACIASFSLLLFAILSPPPVRQILEARGIIEPDEWLVALHDHSPEHDESAGCALTPRRLVRFDGGEPTASVVLRGAEVRLEGQEVVVEGGSTVRCPFRPGEDPATFASEVRRFARSM